MKKLVLILAMLAGVSLFGQEVTKKDSLEIAINREQVVNSLLKKEIKEKSKTQQQIIDEELARKQREEAEIIRLTARLNALKSENDSLKIIKKGKF